MVSYCISCLVKIYIFNAFQKLLSVCLLFHLRSKSQPTKTPVDGYNNDAYCNIGSAEQAIKTENEYENVAAMTPKDKK